MKKVGVSRRKVQVGFKGFVSDRDERVLGWEYSPETLNFAVDGGVLTGKLGIDAARGFVKNMPEAYWNIPDLPDSSGIRRIFHFRRDLAADADRLVVQTIGGDFYEIDLFTASSAWSAIEGLHANEDAVAVNYKYDGKNILIVSAPDLAITVYDGTTVTPVTNGLKFAALEVHGERVFGVYNGKRGSVWFSDNLDPTDWTVSADAGGYIAFGDDCGDAIGLVSFLGYLYIFRERGIYRLTAYGDQGEFMLKKLFTSTGCIYKDTIALCGDRIMFLDDEGVKSFDGYDVTDPGVQLPGDIVYRKYSVGAYSGGAYHLTFHINYSGKYDMEPLYYCSTLVRYRLAEKDVAVLAGWDIRHIAAVASMGCSGLFVASGSSTHKCKLGRLSESGKFYGTPSHKIYRSPASDLGYDGIKVVRELTFTLTGGEVTVSLDADGKRVYSRSFEPTGLPVTAFVGRSGRQLALTVTSDAALPSMTPPAVRVDLVR